MSYRVIGVHCPAITARRGDGEVRNSRELIITYRCLDYSFRSRVCGLKSAVCYLFCGAISNRPRTPWGSLHGEKPHCPSGTTLHREELPLFRSPTACSLLTHRSTPSSSPTASLSLLYRFSTLLYRFSTLFHRFSAPCVCHCVKTSGLRLTLQPLVSIPFLGFTPTIDKEPVKNAPKGEPFGAKKDIHLPG